MTLDHRDCPATEPDLPEPVDPLRVTERRGGAPRAGGKYVLYWCQVQRRAEHSPALDYAVARADALGLPVVVYEGLRSDYPHASWRHHRFILDGVAQMAERLEARGIAHAFYLQEAAAPRRKVLLEAAAQAALVVTDDYPAFIVPTQVARAAAQLQCPFYSVDGAGVAPLAAFPRAEVGAYTLRPKLKRLLPNLLHAFRPRHPGLTPQRSALDLPPPAGGLWRARDLPRDAAALDALVRRCGVDLSVRPAPGVRGGRDAGLQRLQRFLQHHLDRYAEGRNHADRDVTSNLSPYLHHGALAALEVAAAARAESPAGEQDGNVAAFLEELLVRRELALNFCHHVPQHQSLDALPAWAQQSLARHAADPRPESYDLATLEAGRTRDPLWNAIQHELVETGEPHGYLRMLWGKRLIEWAPTYALALQWMIHLNDKYAYDGRDANSYASFLWCFGLHDRPFPRRPIFGVLRPMTSASTGRKAGASGYISRVRRATEPSLPL